MEEFIRVPIETFSEIFGMLPSWLAILVFISAALTSGMMLSRVTGAPLLGAIGSGGAMIFGAYLGVIPLWLAIIFCIFTSATISFNLFYRDSGDGDAQELILTIGDEWNNRGEKLKVAYEAKFGGKNLAFNAEVDTRIKILNNLSSRSSSYKIAKDWVNRMNEFTEAK